MAKELPYFEFEPAEYLSGNVSFCSLEAQGLFTLICCYYWQRSCSLNKDQLLKRINKPKELKELIDEGVIKLDSKEYIIINFLNEKYEKATIKSKINSINGAKGGRPKKPIKTEKKPTALNPLSESKGIIEDNIIEENIRGEEKNKHIPSFDDFLIHAVSKKPKIDRTLVKLKYDSWVENDWKDGNDKIITNWRSKLTNTVPYIQEEKDNQPQFASPIL